MPNLVIGEESPAQIKLKSIFIKRLAVAQDLATPIKQGPNNEQDKKSQVFFHRRRWC